MILGSIKTGGRKGIETTLMLAKIIIPVYIAVTILKYTPVLDFIAERFSPVMSIFGLPGEAALILVLGNILNIYAALGAMSAVSLTAAEISIIALMLSFSHSLLIETAVTRKLGVSSWKIILIRMGLAVMAGLILGRILI